MTTKETTTAKKAQTRATKKPMTKRTPKKSGGYQVVILDHARVDPSHCLADGLFRPLQKGTQKGSSLDIHYRYKGFTFWWRNYRLLSIADQSVFLALHRLAAERGRTETVGPQHADPTMLEVRGALNMRLQAAELDCLAFTTSLREMAENIGMTVTGPNLRAIKESLLRLSGVSFVIYKGEDETSTFWQANLISNLAGVDGKIYVAVNPLLSKALVGTPSSYINMAEQRLLNSDAAKRLHVWLSSWAPTESSRTIALDNLIQHVWGTEESSADAVRKRRGYLRKAIIEIGNLEGWLCEEDKSTNMVQVMRPPMGTPIENSNKHAVDEVLESVVSITPSLSQN